MHTRAPTSRGQVNLAATAANGAHPYYRYNWNRLGFTEEKVSSMDPRFVAHVDAGADHVRIQPLDPSDRVPFRARGCRRVR